MVPASLCIVTSWAVAARAHHSQTNLPFDPPRERGTSITPAYEGWFTNPYDSLSMLLGYAVAGSPSRMTPSEVRAIEDMVTSPDYRHVRTGTLAVLAQRLGTVWASPSTWYRLVRQHGSLAVPCPE
jgi:hypothetical protein